METTGVAKQIYETSIKSLPIIERLQLVKLVMDDLMANSTTWVVDESDVWSDEDYADLSRISLAYAVNSSLESPE